MYIGLPIMHRSYFSQTPLALPYDFVAIFRKAEAPEGVGWSHFFSQAPRKMG